MIPLPRLLLTKVGYFSFSPAAAADKGRLPHGDVFPFFPASDVDIALGLAAFREVMLAHVPTRP